MQFKLQRDMLTQLTGINDPQQTKTLLALLADQQSGKQLTTQENKTLEDALKSGASKQDESKSLAEKIGKAQMVLMAQSALSLSNIAAAVLTPQTESALINKGTEKMAEGSVWASDKISGFMTMALAEGQRFFEQNASEGVKNAASNVGNAASGMIERSKENNYQTAQQRIPGFNTGEEAKVIGGPSVKFNNVEIPRPAAPTPQFIASPPSTEQNDRANRQQITPEQKPRDEIHGTMTIHATDELTRAIANAAVIQINKGNRGHS
jgi:hypothetical protein